MKKNIDSLAKASKDLMLGEPFYGLLLMALNKVWDKKVGTLGVGLDRINYHLIINPEFWEKHAPIVKKGLLKHELLHIAFFHVTDFDGYKDKKVLNFAMDIVVNQYIERQWLPEDGVFLDTFPELELEEKKSTKYYYNKLMEEKESDEHGYSGMLSQNPGGGGDDPSDGDGMANTPGGSQVRVPNHDWEEMMAGLDEPTKKLLESQTGHIIEQVADQVEKSRGIVPGEFTELLERLRHIEPPKFDWKGYIRKFTGRSTKTYTKKSRRKENKRLPDLPGLKIKQKNHILLGIDTSGSVSSTELKQIQAEMHHIYKTGADITIIQCDTAISNIAPYNPREKDWKIHGRGGTEFQPVINYYKEHQREFSALMYYTDGECSPPVNARGSILWILSHAGDMEDMTDFPGDVIQIEL